MDRVHRNANDPDSMVTGLFPEPDPAELAYEGIVTRGHDTFASTPALTQAAPLGSLPAEVEPDDLEEDSEASTDSRTQAAEGAGVGSAVGGTIGAVAVAVIATGASLAVPGVGLVIVGPVAAALAGAGAGGIAGGVLGALIGSALSEEPAAAATEPASRQAQPGVMRSANPNPPTRN
jgi:hypothetical protein